MTEYTIQKVNELPILSPSSGDYFMGVGSAIEYRSTIDIIAKYIVSTAKTIGNKTVQEALANTVQSISLVATDDGRGNVILSVAES